MANYNPVLPYNNDYELKIEWPGLDMNHTHQVDGKSNDVFCKSDFQSFMNNYYENNLKLIDVSYNNSNFVNKYNANPDYVIQEFKNILDTYCINFLAINQEQNCFIIVRELHLISFPKYFENWILYRISEHTTFDYYQQLNHLISMNYRGTRCWKVSDYVLMAIINYKAKQIGNTKCSNKIIVDYVTSRGSKYSRFLIDNVLIGPDIIKDHSSLERLSCGLYDWFDDQYYGPNSTADFLDIFINFTKFLKNIRLFNYAFRRFEDQDQLFVGMPLNIEDRKLNIF